jgi:DNA-binding NtrC family response regulator
VKEEISALLLHNRPDPLCALKTALRRLSVRTREAKSCQEAVQVLQGPNPPQLLFTDDQVADGAWPDAIRLAMEASRPVNVIVVSRLVDVRFYIEAIERGAFDFIAPPFNPSELDHVVRCAAGNVVARRQP